MKRCVISNRNIFYNYSHSIEITFFSKYYSSTYAAWVMPIFSWHAVVNRYFLAHYSKHPPVQMSVTHNIAIVHSWKIFWCHCVETTDRDRHKNERLFQQISLNYISSTKKIKFYHFPEQLLNMVFIVATASELDQLKQLKMSQDRKRSLHFNNHNLHSPRP